MLTYQGERVKDEVEKLAAEFGGAQVVECDVSSDASLEAMRAEVDADRQARRTRALHGVREQGGSRGQSLRYQPGTVSRSRSSLVPSRWSRSYKTLREQLNDGASVMALTYLGATQIVPNYNLMGIAKAALESSMRYLAFDLGDRGIRVNAISAGPIKTASMRQVGGATKMLDVVPKVAPLRRNVTAEDVGNTAVYLASDLSSAITADVHFVDAGYHMMGFYPPDFESDRFAGARPSDDEVAAIVAALAASNCRHVEAPAASPWSWPGGIRAAEPAPTWRGETGV